MQTIMFGDSSDQNYLFPLQVMLNYANVDVCSIGLVDDLWDDSQQWLKPTQFGRFPKSTFSCFQLKLWLCHLEPSESFTFSIELARIANFGSLEVSTWMKSCPKKKEITNSKKKWFVLFVPWGFEPQICLARVRWAKAPYLISAMGHCCCWRAEHDEWCNPRLKEMNDHRARKKSATAENRTRDFRITAWRNDHFSTVAARNKILNWRDPAGNRTQEQQFRRLPQFHYATGSSMRERVNGMRWYRDSNSGRLGQSQSY